MELQPRFCAYPDRCGSRAVQAPPHFRPELMLECADKVIEWVQDYSDSIRVRDARIDGEP